MEEIKKELLREQEQKEEDTQITCIPEENPKGGNGKLWHNNSGVGVVEIILILVVLVALVVIFKEQLTGMVEKAMSALEESMEGILS